MKDRKELVLELIRSPKSVELLLKELAEHGWYCEKHLATITKSDVLAVLKQFQSSLLTAAEVNCWANSVGGRPDIAFEFGPDGVVEESLFWLAHPELEGELNHELCQKIVMLYERRKVPRK